MTQQTRNTAIEILNYCLNELNQNDVVNAKEYNLILKEIIFLMETS